MTSCFQTVPHGETGGNWIGTGLPSSFALAKALVKAWVGLWSALPASTLYKTRFQIIRRTTSEHPGILKKNNHNKKKFCLFVCSV